jgi:hypothetical protein
MVMDSNAGRPPLTHDEKNAAEAAFSGRPFNPKWSAGARLVYEGIVKALPIPTQDETPVSETTGASMESSPTEPAPRLESQQTSDPTRIPFQRALETGALIDVTHAAKELGLSFPVTVTRPLWETGIAPTHTATQERSGRLRDVLMAFRLRLATQPTASPLVDFPALLSFPPSAVPQTIPLFALIQPDEHNQVMVTLLLPNEVSASIIPLN